MSLLRTTTTALSAVLLTVCLTTTVEAAASPPDLSPHDGSAVGFDPAAFTHATLDTAVPANGRPCFIEQDQWNSALDGPQPGRG